MKYDLSLSIPHYNEEDNVAINIPALFAVFQKEKISLEVVAVDNGSADRTFDELRKLQRKYPALRIVRLAKNAGFGGGIRAGLAKCASGIIGFTCADTQIHPKSIVALYRQMKKDGLAMAKTRRVTRQDGFYRLILTKIFNIICRMLFDVRTKDINGYPVLMRKSLFERMNLKMSNWMINIEILVKANLLRQKWGEVDVVFYKREKGKSIVKLATIMDFIFQIISFAMQYRFSREYKDLRKSAL